MLFIKPEYFDNFKCIASACQRSCCVGWEIGIDEESKYKYLAMEYGGDSYITDAIKMEERCFLQDGGGRCHMLDENGLCEIIKRYGEGCFARYAVSIQDTITSSLTGWRAVLGYAVLRQPRQF